MPAAERRRSETDNRPMLDPRDGRGEVVVGFTGAGTVPGEGGTLRCGSDEEVEEDRDGGREFRSGDMMSKSAYDRDGRAPGSSDAQSGGMAA